MRHDGRSNWQRRYDESLAREQEKYDEVSTGAVVGTMAIGCLPGVIGFAGLALAAVFGAVIQWRRRRRRERA